MGLCAAGGVDDSSGRLMLLKGLRLAYRDEQGVVSPEGFIRGRFGAFWLFWLLFDRFTLIIILLL